MDPRVLESRVLAITRIAAELEHEVDHLAKQAAQMEVKLDKANADIEHRKVDLLRLQSEASSNDSDACRQRETKSATEDAERAIMDQQRSAMHLREMLAALEEKQAAISCELRQVKAERNALQSLTQTANTIETAQ
jgi:predicted  nucleic acid-binding Zn-ribbon protein